MSLSRVHRAKEFASLQQVHYASFDGGAQSQSPSQGATQAPQPAPATPSSEEAFARGRQAGLKEAEEQFQQAAQTLAQALEELSRLREAILTNSSRDMLRLVLSIARQVVHCEVEVKPEIVLSTIDMALQAAVESDSYTVMVNPRDLALVEERKPLFLASIKSLDNIHFRADEAVAPGGCLVESSLGQVDATIDGQLEEVRKALLEGMEKES